MAVSLKKRDKVDLSKPDIPPKVREYTPVHLLDEEETIVNRSRFPPPQIEHTLPQHNEQAAKEITPVTLDMGNMRFKRPWGFYFSLFVPVIVAGLVVLLIFLIGRLAPSENAPTESTTTVSAPVEVVTSSPADEAITDTSSTEKNLKDLLASLGELCNITLKNPVFILVLVFVGFSVLARLSRVFTHRN